jgi:hypothetical protein
VVVYKCNTWETTDVVVVEDGFTHVVARDGCVYVVGRQLLGVDTNLDRLYGKVQLRTLQLSGDGLLTKPTLQIVSQPTRDAYASVKDVKLASHLTLVLDNGRCEVINV